MAGLLFCLPLIGQNESVTSHIVKMEFGQPFPYDKGVAMSVYGYEATKAEMELLRKEKKLQDEYIQTYKRTDQACKEKIKLKDELIAEKEKRNKEKDKIIDQQGKDIKRLGELVDESSNQKWLSFTESKAAVAIVAILTMVLINR